MLRISDDRAIAARSPAWNGAALLLGAVLLCAALLAGGFSAVCGAMRPWRFFALQTAAVATAVFLVFPRYLHNDQIGLNLRRDWGYRGWGYVDTMREIARQTSLHGFSGIWNVQDFGKPFLLQAAALPFAHLFGDAGPALFSALVTAVFGAGLGLIACERRGRETAIAVVALFVFNSVVLAYATSFYQEAGLLAGIVWCSLCWYASVRRGRPVFAALALACAVIAASSKHPLASLLVGFSVGMLLLYLRVPFRRSLFAAASSTIAGFAGTLAFWPTVWLDPSFRIPFVLGARIAFDAAHGFSVPLSGRVAAVAIQWAASLSPLEAMLCIAGLAFAIARRGSAAFLLVAGVAGCLAFTLPTSLFLQHYLLYAMPFTLLLCAEGLRWFTRVPAPARIAAIGLVQTLWLMPYLPYTGMARLTCFSAQCALERFAPSEPAYGLREAAQWLRANSQPGDVIVTSAAAHTLQANLPDREVLSTGTWSDASGERQNIAVREPRFVVSPAYGTYNGDRVDSLGLPLVYATSPRDGYVRIYRWNGRSRPRTPDLPARDLLAIAGDPKRIVFIDAGAEVRGDSGLSEIVRWAWHSPADGPKPTPCNAGSGVIVTPAQSDLSRAYRRRHEPYTRAGPFDAFTIRVLERC